MKLLYFLIPKSCKGELSFAYDAIEIKPDLRINIKVGGCLILELEDSEVSAFEELAERRNSKLCPIPVFNHSDRAGASVAIREDFFHSKFGQVTSLIRAFIVDLEKVKSFNVSGAEDTWKSRNDSFVDSLNDLFALNEEEAAGLKSELTKITETTRVRAARLKATEQFVLDELVTGLRNFSAFHSDASN